MKPLLFCALILVLPSLVLPHNHSLYAQRQYPPTQAQKEAIQQWANVVRRGQTAKIMYEVADLLRKVTGKVKTHKDRAKNFVFFYALERMHKGAVLKAQGLKKRDQKLLDQSESMIKLSVNIINGRIGM